MGSKRLDKISDYARHGYSLKVDCRDCRHNATVDARALSALCTARNWSRDMGAVQARLKCSACGSRNVRCGPGFAH